MRGFNANKCAPEHLHWQHDARQSRIGRADRLRSDLSANNSGKGSDTVDERPRASVLLHVQYVRYCHYNYRRCEQP